MIKKLFYFLFVVLLAITCSKNDEREEITMPDDPIQMLMQELKFDLNTFKSPLLDGLNDSLFFISGPLKDSQKYGFIGFNINTKKKLFNLIQFEPTTITIDLPYGESNTFNLEYILVDGYSENNNSKVVYLKAGGSFYDQVGYIYFINDNKAINVINPSADNEYIKSLNIISWNHNYLFAIGTDNLSYYSSTGDKIIPVELLRNYININGHYDNINDFEAISFLGDIIQRIDLRVKYPLWSKSIEIGNINNPRIDNIKLTSKTNSYYTYEFYYTEFSGNKGVIKFRVNIETGEIEYL